MAEPGGAGLERRPDDARLRSAHAADAGAIAALAARCFAEPWSRAAVQAELVHPDAHALLIESAGRPVAYLLARRVLDELHVMHMGVDPAARRRGLAGALLARALGAGARAVWLEVRATNAPARAFYAKHGFVAVGRRSRYYPGGEDAVLMNRETA
ncbi:MAG: ribosomal protein S18-alanine N-acetyltransferase [Myxococcota bacterium]|nr:ribosomal protein S18-alanine N-acetyltransferase [Myxococcota bacterium]